MGRFTFRLQKVLDHRLRVEDVKKQAFVKSRLSHLREKRILDDFHDSLKECNSRPVTGGGAFFYISKYNYITLLEERIEDQSKKVKVLYDEMNEKKLEFEDSQKDRKVLDKLKDKAYSEYNSSNDKEEQKQNDEFAIFGYVRK